MLHRDPFVSIVTAQAHHEALGRLAAHLLAHLGNLTASSLDSFERAPLEQSLPGRTRGKRAAHLVEDFVTLIELSNFVIGFH